MICPYCLKSFKRLTKDHIFPKSWYPESNPKNIQRLTIKVCNLCNKTHGKNEEELLWRFGLCLPWDDIYSQGIPQKVLKSINPNFTNDTK